MINFDITLLEKLVQNKILICDFAIGNIKLGNSYKSIPVDEITEIYLWNSDDDLTNINADLTIKERIAKLENYNGYMHLVGGLSCRIKNKVIENYTIEGKYLTSICDYTRADIVTNFGNSIYELIDYSSDYGGYGYQKKAYILVYQNKRLNISTHPKTEKIIEICTDLLDVENFQKR